MLKIKTIDLLTNLELLSIDKKSVQINTINAHSYNVAQKDEIFAKVLLQSDFLLPDGQSIVYAKKILTRQNLKRIAGFDLFQWEMERMNDFGGKCFFLGSTNETLQKILDKVVIEYPKVKAETYSPPYKAVFSFEDNQRMIEKINSVHPDVLFVGMTAPKQEKWVYENKDKLKTGHICSIGAVFDFYAGNIQRAPKWMQNKGLEWLYRLMKEPRRMWKRYIIGNTKFIFYILKEKISD
ncbi:MAG: WecB/TagA/CpsF family glycosyltransferase [Prevotella sp.]|jgi:N-acetylglucosaminyldiphosphoundecaprenol N-acetyl-beta-D-mannosaminyltransferase|nr:WecB/TagA/CpsF family glycosyltransferase [Prevotella sp.]